MSLASASNSPSRRQRMGMELFYLSGRVALVTGSSRGIGLAIGEMLADAGAKVAISSRKQEDCDSAATRINSIYGMGRAIACAADLSDKRSLEYLVSTTRAELGPIDILICNAASNPYFGPMSAISDENFQAILAENILANHWLVQMSVPDMIERKDGAIVLVSSVGAYTGSLMTGVYNMAKAALDQMVRNLALEFGPYNIRVNGIAPGSTRTDFARPLWEDPDKEARLANATVLGRIAEPHELAGPALLLASPAASFITGQTLLVDGGRLAWRGDR
jgi:NAD(P)-dependent dehydrogenase (short-subunit alcohol dehydrogenase family)